MLVLTGGRQTGKTGLCRHLFPTHHDVSLDLLIGEVQQAPGLFRRLKAVVDGQRERCGQIVLAGSQPFMLMKIVGESLAGRAAILSTAPQTSTTSILLRGGFAELWSQPAIDISDFHRSSVATI